MSTDLVHVEVPTTLAPPLEVRQLIREYAAGVAMREVAMFRVWRIWKDALFLQVASDIPGEEGRPMYPTWSDFLRDLCRSLGVSRAKVYNRVKTYAMLDWLGYGSTAMLDKMAYRPGVIENTLNAIFVYDPELRAPTALKTDVFGTVLNDELKSEVRSFIDSLDAFDSVGEALAHLRQDVLGGPSFSLSYRDSNIVLFYDIENVDESTGEVDIESGVVQFVPDGDVPEWLVGEVCKKHKITL